MNKINIALSASKDYIPYAGVVISSFIKTHPNSDLDFYIFYLDSSIINYKYKFLNIIKESNSNNNLEFVKVDYQDIEFVNIDKGWPLDLWCRWYLLDYLKDKCDRVLVLGIDTLLKGNIIDFYFQNLNGYYFAGCPDMWINNSESNKWEAIKKNMDAFNFKNKSQYINADVVIVNLNETRNNLSFKKFLKLYLQNKFICWDQDTINFCFNHKIKFQDYSLYNYFPNLKIKNHDDIVEFNKAKIIHFAGGPKPWRVPICEAKNYIGVKEWYNYADSLGITSNWDYIQCYSQLPFRKIWRYIKKILKYLLKW